MTKRVRARELTLVNWKGVFYERYLLDSNVTALEGDNGAGKTTVMIAAYVVLFPDLSRLRFTNIGETGATGGDKGIWGRLGQLARPSYSALTLRLGDGRELIAGVVIVRKSEPTLELQPFLISNLPLEARARDYLLKVADEHDEIPTVAEVKQAVAAAGAKLELFATSKAYFAALFDLGVSPMRLSTDEERNKYNDMLRTSMAGGISRTLTSELRSFVFKRETGLSDTLSRMRGNLSACRRTRVEVVESRQLERHISGIYDAGLSMFEASMLAARFEALETAAELARAKNALDQAEASLVEQGVELTEAGARSASITERLEAAREAAHQAGERLERYQRCLQTAERVSELEAELRESNTSLEQAQQRYDEATASRTHARQRWSEVQAALSRSAQGLANLQTGLEQLHRRAHAHRQVMTELERAHASLALAGFAPELLRRLESPTGAGESDAMVEYLTALRNDTAAQLEHTDEQRARRARLSESADVQRREYEQAMAALREVIGENDAADIEDSPLAAARSRLKALSELEVAASTLAASRAELASLESAHRRQLLARERIALLELSNDIDGKALHEQVSGLDAEVRLGREQTRDASWQARLLSEQAQSLTKELAELEEAAQRYVSLEAHYQRLLDAGILIERGDESWDEASAALDGRISRLEQHIAQLSSEQQEALAQAARFEASEETPSEELCRLRDAVGGEFLSRCYEDLEPEEARYVEASLGPLRDAIVVADLDQARQLLADEPPSLADVWLVASAAELGSLGVRDLLADKALVVPTDSGVRISRLPEFASLGRAARKRRAASLRKLAASRATTLEEEERELRRLRELGRGFQCLFRERRLWRDGDPLERVKALSERVEEAATAAVAERERATEATARADAASARAEALRPLLLDAPLLDERELGERLAACRERAEAATAARAELGRVQPARATLQRLIDALRVEPPDDATLAEWRQAQAELDAKRDALFRASEALTASIESIHALDFVDASAALASQNALVPELEQQHRGLESKVVEAELAYSEREVRWESATEALQQAKSRHGAINAHLERAQTELSDAGTESPDAATFQRLEQEAGAARRRVRELDEKSRELFARMTLATERRTTSAARRDEEIQRVVRIEQRFEPAQRAWQALRQRAAEAGLQLPASAQPQETSQRLWAQARSRRQLLSDRLEATGEASELLLALEGATREDAIAYLELWQAVRRWLHKRLPAQVAEVADPLDALNRLRDDLTTLESRLRHQETELRGASEDVARSIEARMRRATRQVRRINQYLEGIRFGSIHGIRIKVGRVDKMTQVLSALRDGSAQELLFQSQMPFEEALDEIFRRYGGGRSGGHRLLDYREYLDLQVEVQRRTESSPWESANPTRVSTGEAIGVGAALMMVILTEWERDANLLRGSRSFGSLRFLFLDEANRLSQDNLGVLFELCQSLDLQLLIAAPEVARADGNTTYRLVRRVAEDGSEEVLVSGRRAKLPDEEPSEQASQVQQVLLGGLDGEELAEGVREPPGGD